MKSRILYAAWIALVPVLLDAGQVPEFRGPTVSEIVRVLGDETAAGGMVARTIAGELERKPSPTVFILAEQIRPEWLPIATGVQYVILDREQARAHIQSCGEYLFVHSITRSGPDATVSVGRGTRCRTAGGTRAFRIGASGWDDVPGVAGGFAGATAHCACP